LSIQNLRDHQVDAIHDISQGNYVLKGTKTAQLVQLTLAASNKIA